MKHVSNIYEKLDVQSSIEALNKLQKIYKLMTKSKINHLRIKIIHSN